MGQDRTSSRPVPIPGQNVCQNESLPNNLIVPTLAPFLIQPLNTKGYTADQTPHLRCNP